MKIVGVWCLYECGDCGYVQTLSVWGLWVYWDCENCGNCRSVGTVRCIGLGCTGAWEVFEYGMLLRMGSIGV